MEQEKPEGRKIIATNRKARHEYFIDETYEAGVALAGTEVKSLRQGKANLQDSFCRVQEGEMWVYNLHISPYEQGNRWNVDARRPRKLLLHKGEIERLIGKVQEKGLTLIPLQIYFKRGRAKLEIALARGKKLYDKREAIAERDARREEERSLHEKG
ncbi:MAG: SsrA-binding protein SmpB [Armatimonadetes bacterium]|nr:SsrA-binding protein SmpB [Armatimonadota bacterium]